MIIQTEKLTKYYGRHRGVVDLDLEVREGEVFGFLGPNGAGKTTTIRILLDFIRATSGRARVFGRDAHDDSVAIRRDIGYLPGELSLYPSLTGGQVLQYLGNLRGGVDAEYVAALAERFNLDLSKKFKEYSRGNKQKVGLVQAFMHRPRLLVLDEPTSGLDPLNQLEFYKLVAETKADGRTVFLSSHIFGEVERTCDRVGIIREGQLVRVAEVAALHEMKVHQVEIHFAGPAPAAAFAALPGVEDLESGDGRLTCTVRGDLDALVKAAAHYTVVTFISHEPSLEELFLTYYGDARG
jgi:ABC-2 type transport system ATP-binding protein